MVAFFCALSFLAVIGRLLSNELTLWNFTPLAAVGLFGGFFFERRLTAAAVTVVAITVSNLFIGTYPNPAVTFTVYAALLFPIALRGIIRTEFSAPRILGCAILSSVVFFVTTNAAHWWFTRAHTFADLCDTYILAVPFFRMTLAGDLCFTAVLFGGYAWSIAGQRIEQGQTLASTAN
jgi:hypothetical protein